MLVACCFVSSMHLAYANNTMSSVVLLDLHLCDLIGIDPSEVKVLCDATDETYPTCDDDDKCSDSSKSDASTCITNPRLRPLRFKKRNLSLECVPWHFRPVGGIKNPVLYKTIFCDKHCPSAGNHCPDVNVSTLTPETKWSAWTYVRTGV